VVKSARLLSESSGNRAQGFESLPLHQTTPRLRLAHAGMNFGFKIDIIRISRGLSFVALAK